MSYTDSKSPKLRLVHRHGPCSPLRNKRKQSLPNDQPRVDYLQRRSRQQTTSMPDASAITASSGSSLSSGEYVVSLAFGTPKLTQTVIFDTGSDVTWIQCQPCLGSCYPQQEPYFDPTKSTTYRNVSCSSDACASLRNPACLDSTCVYRVRYGDGSQTSGFFGQDTLTLTSASDTVSDFQFGCGQSNDDQFGRTAGLLGLARGPTSLISQTAVKYHSVFSYCLPPSDSSAGYLSLGSSPPSTNVQFTPMLSREGGVMASFYFLELQGIVVGGKRLEVPPTLFSNAGVIIDSGTVITRLPPTAYTALRAEFRKGMMQYPMAPAAGILDTCYDVRNYSAVEIPTVVMQYKEVAVSLDPTGILYGDRSTLCLAFAANSEDGDLGIIGNTQQRRFNVVYDVDRKLIGFGAGGC